ncbi:hypothetical protein WJX72_003736 [[Myrmecia] bisecta]|uniref:Bardet-Biedl syndrome 1 n=1 Tax=[Myrmecia] bisecta TaxID=41462 RepID=A0AAW1PVZ1_9CHLO
MVCKRKQAVWSDWRLVIADDAKKLKVWKGTSLASEQALLQEPCAVASFYSDLQLPRVPSLAVAAGAHVYIYRNLRPYYKFTVPVDAVDPQEQAAWQSWQSVTARREGELQQLVEALTQLKGSGAPLTQPSLQLISLHAAGVAEHAAAAAEQQKGLPLARPSPVTCMGSIRKSLEQVDALSCLVLGTECGSVMILDPTGSNVTHTVRLGAAPSLLAISGLLDVDYRIAVATRSGRVYVIRNGELAGAPIELEAPAVGLLAAAKTLLAGCMNSSVACYTHKGKRLYRLQMPAVVHAMDLLELTRQRMVTCLLVALANGEIRIYNGQHLVSMHSVNAPVAALYFGKYGREDNTLITITKSGALDIKILPRNASLEAPPGPAGPPPEQEIPLDIPKKTSVYIEQTERERANAVEMHTAFQQQLLKLRLLTARSYVKVLTDGQGSISHSSAASLQLNACVLGLGPYFKIKLTLRNNGAEPTYDLPVVATYKPSLYSCPVNQFVIGVLLPGREYNFELSIRSLNPALPPDDVRIVVVNPAGNVPLLSAIVKMPLSEFEEE